MKRLRIRNGRVIDPAQGLDRRGDLFIADGRIQAIGQANDQANNQASGGLAGFDADIEIDATGLVVCPGLIDLRAHLREPGQEHKATIASEVRAARASGITTLCCPPDTDPVVDTPAVAELIRARAEVEGTTRVLPLGALTQGLKGEVLAEMAALKGAGCVAVSNAMMPLANTLVLRRALEYATTFDLTVFIQPQDCWLADHGCAHEGPVATRLGLPGIPVAAETAALAQALVLLEQTGARAHFFMLSSEQAVAMVAAARKRKLPVTADVSALHLHLTEVDIADFDANTHVRPPLRSRRDLDGLRRGLSDGSLSAICSDHQPHEADAKLAPFCVTEPGLSALETLLPLSLRLVHDGALDLPTLIGKLTHEPAAILGQDLGTLQVGATADLCIFDPERYWTLDAGQMLSAGHNTPFNGWELRGRVTHTVFGGKLVFDLDQP